MVSILHMHYFSEGPELEMKQLALRTCRSMVYLGLHLRAPLCDTNAHKSEDCKFFMI